MNSTDAMSLPISAIKDGWALKDGQLYLIVECEPGKFVTVTLPLGEGGQS